MTSTVPDTGVIEGIDEQGRLICDAPSCQNTAVQRDRMWCTCCHLCCKHHHAETVRIAKMLIKAKAPVGCQTCDAWIKARRVSDVIVAVIPL